MSKYTDEIVERIVAEYTEKRDAGELNRDILDYLTDLVAVEFDVEVNPASLRAKLNGTERLNEEGEPGGEYVYRKDTDAEKEILAARTGKVKAQKHETKAEVAARILEALKVDVDLAGDLARAKVDTLKALDEAVRALG